MSERKTISWDKPMLERLRKAYKAAVEAKADQFDFEGNQFVTNYAKYLIEHLDNQFGRKR